MEFEKHAFGIGVITGLFLSCLDIQLSHYLQSLLWPLESPEMIEEYLPKILVALEEIAKPNSAEVKLVWISRIAAALTLFVIIVSIWSSKLALKKAENANQIAKNQAERSRLIEDDKVRFESLRELYSSAYFQIFNKDSNLPNNKPQNWILSAQDLLESIRVKSKLNTDVYNEIAETEIKLWQRKFQNLLSSDPEYKSLRAEFFYGVADWQNVDIKKLRF